MVIAILIMTSVVVGVLEKEMEMVFFNDSSVCVCVSTVLAPVLPLLVLPKALETDL